MSVERKLAAIMFTDIAGYTESMSKSESKTLDLLDKKRNILNSLLKKHSGTFVKEIGDGTLTYFESAVNAATCAVKLQEQTYDDKDMNIRAGIHIGDIVFKDGDVFGDGVNVASRLESITPSGGVCVSKNVYDELINQDDFDGIELGLQSLKGVGRLIEVFGLKGKKLTEPNPDEYQENKIEKHSDDEVPSIAIIPFDNKGADEDVFYTYGISADLISDCSSAGLIRVASLNNIEKIKGYDKLQAEDLAKKLDVRYTAGGTLWKMDNIFQLSVELYDTKDKKVVWSDRWQEKWDNLPMIKGNLSDGLLKALDTKPKVEQKINTINTEAYEFYLKAKHKYRKRKNTNDIEIARGLLSKAIELDDNLILAHTKLGRTYLVEQKYDKAMEIFTHTLQKAQEIKDKLGVAENLRQIGNYYSYIHGYDKSIDYYNSALKITEEIDDKTGIWGNLYNIGRSYMYKGDFDKSLQSLTRSLIISEELNDKFAMTYPLYGLGEVYLKKVEYDKAMEYFTRSHELTKELELEVDLRYTYSQLAKVYINFGQYEMALANYMSALNIYEKLGDKYWVGWFLSEIGIVYVNIGDYKKAEEYLEQSLALSTEFVINTEDLLWATTHLYLTYKHLGKAYDVKEIHSLIKETKNIDFRNNQKLYELLEDKSYLETAYNQVQEKALVINDKSKFLNYPLPKAIIEEYNKVFKK